MTSHRFSQVDVFAGGPLQGNPVAVVHDADGLTDAEMAAFARWTNLSETTFLLRPQDPGADYRLRIWTPGGELPFAGHPTLGSAHAWLEAGGRPARGGVLVQECGAGLVSVRREEADGLLSFAAPPLRRSGEPDEAELDAAVAALGVEPETVVRAAWTDNGPGWLSVQLRSAREVLELRPDMAAMTAAGLRIGAVGLHPAGSACAIELRAFVPGLGVPEDPVTGSLNAGVAQWLVGEGVLPGEYTAAQGTVLGRAGRVRVRSEANGAIWVGGATATRIRGVLDLNERPR
ncbi:MAG: PhzF family phenazine biosynthesis protein [Pseudoclavibacter sp.]|nr:PhzF family phenazine biosynthesis protein [Pseudoclavibacter sp.]